MTGSFDWAREMGIDVTELVKEHPLHPQQLRMKRIINRNAQRYWAHDRYLARIADVIPVEAPEEIPAKKPYERKKPAKVKRYEFTDRQLEIARRVLNGEGSV